VRPTPAFGWIRAGHRRATTLLLASAIAVIALLAVFATELANTQADSKAEIKSRVHERAVLAAALVDSLFGTVTQQIPAEERSFDGPQISDALLQKERGTAHYLVIVTPGGKILGSSAGFTAQAQAELNRSGALQLVKSGDPYALGDLVPYGKSGVIDLVVPLSTKYGRRLLVEGVPPASLSGFLSGTLRRIPGVAGSHNLLFGTNDAVIASNEAARPVGYRVRSAASRAALGRTSGDRNGRYYDQVPLTDSTWRIVLSAPSGALFASVTGLHEWVPWLILLAFALIAAVALGLGWRLLHSAERDLECANAELADVNHKLEASNVQLERRATELARSNAELEQFASIASHDLQEPLRKIRTFTEQLAATESDRLSERGADYAARANRAAARMQGLIQDLLQFSRVTSKPREFSQVDVGEITSEVLDDLSVEIEESDATVSVGALPTISADSLQIRQLVLNLISNAIKFRRPDVAPEISIRGDVSGDTAYLVVADNGIGFDAQYSTRIFRVFERLNGRDEYPGTGIGLALCHKIAMRHGGGIVASGELGTGATFTVTLPVEHTIPEPDGTAAFDSIFDDAKEHADAIK
jgi:signal transduction histidine kinase